MKKVLFGVLLILLCAVSAAWAETADVWTEISDAEGLAAMAENPEGKYRLTCDIDMTGVDWKPISFSGELDGNGHGILNLTVKQIGDTRFTSRDGNNKKYQTAGAGLFDCASNASIHDLDLLGVEVDVATDEHCFAAALMGGGFFVDVTNCNISGSVHLTSGAQNVGVAGVGGYMCGNITGCDVLVELLYADTNQNLNSEEFAGGAIACGYGDIIDCTIRSYIYASVHGYCHNGGVIGMYTKGGVSDASVLIMACKVGSVINFFEDVRSRRAYASLYIGEELYGGVTTMSNEKIRFKVNESKDYSKTLYPCTCGVERNEEVFAATAEEYGYTVVSCPNCGYTFMTDYTVREPK